MIWACVKTEQKSKDWFKLGLKLRGRGKYVKKGMAEMQL